MPTLNNLTTYHRAFIEALAKESKPISAKSLREKIVLEYPKYRSTADSISPKKIIRDLRINCIPVCEKGGYYYARTVEDLNAYITLIEDKMEEVIVNRLKASGKNVGYPDRLVFTLFWDMPVRTDRNTVAMEQFEIDLNGQPINIRGLEIMR